MSWRDDLIRIYSVTPVAAIGRDPEYVQLCERYKREPGFAATRNDIEMAKQVLEEFMTGVTTSRQRLKAGLGLLMGLHREREYKRRDLCRELIKAANLEEWTVAQQEYFEAA